MSDFARIAIVTLACLLMAFGAVLCALVAVARRQNRFLRELGELPARRTNWAAYRRIRAKLACERRERRERRTNTNGRRQ